MIHEIFIHVHGIDSLGTASKATLVNCGTSRVDYASDIANSRQSGASGFYGLA